jgi:LEA14-like dessication related protein
MRECLILTVMISDLNFLISTLAKDNMRHPDDHRKSFSIGAGRRHFFGLMFILLMLTISCKPKEDVQLRKINDIVVDASSEPLLRANAILFNPNNIRMTVKKIDLEVFVEGKKAAIIDQQLKIRVPANNEFTIPLEVKLNLKEMGLMDTVFALIGGKKMQIHYKGHIRLQKSGVPFNVPVNYKEEVRIRL